MAEDKQDVDELGEAPSPRDGPGPDEETTPDGELGGPRFEADPRGDSGGFTRRLMGLGADVINRSLVGAVSAVFMTEEGIRSAVSDLRLPKDAARALIQQADTTKREVFRIVGREVREFLETSNIAGAIANSLTDATVEIHTTIRFSKDEDGEVIPEVESVYSRVSSSDEKATVGGGDARPEPDEGAAADPAATDGDDD